MTTGVIADLCADLLIKSKVTPIYGQVEQFVDDYTIEIGGSAALFATQYARLGGQINIYGIVGHDILGHMIQNRISEEGIDTSFITFSENEKKAGGCPRPLSIFFIDLMIYSASVHVPLSPPSSVEVQLAFSITLMS